MNSNTYLSMLALASAAFAQSCALEFDGRVAAGSTVASFDAGTTPFGTKFIFGQNLTQAKIIQLPTVAASLFDSTNSTLATEVTISDESIFAPSATNIQTGFRRAELQIARNSGTDSSTTGIKTLHFSLRKDTARPLNTCHEYQLVFLESNDFSTNQFALKTGTISGQNLGQDPNLLLILQGNVNTSPVVKLFNTSFTADVWHNFAITLDFTANTTAVLYSTDSNVLTEVTAATTNGVHGQGQYHPGMLKKSTGEGLTDVTKQGFQEPGINEGIIYGGIFMEDSTGGCINKSAGGVIAATNGTTNGTMDGGAKASGTKTKSAGAAKDTGAKVAVGENYA